MTIKSYMASALAMVSLAATAPQIAARPSSGQSSTLSGLTAIATVDERFQSYNVEMVEVTGGRFWAPYGGPPDEVYRMRPPEDLADRRLRALTRQLGPAYMRVSGTWANSTYLEAEAEHLTAPPTGYKQVLTRAQWRGVVDFARAVDARIGVSYAVGEGGRAADGSWTVTQAQRLLDLTRSVGGDIAFSEFINEPNAASLGSLPKNYSVADYARDFSIFRAWARRAAPAMRIVGPSGVGEGGGLDRVPVASLEKMLLTDRLMALTPASVDVVSYHFYGAVSQRCKGTVGPKIADQAVALTPEWLDLTLRDWHYYSGLRNKYESGKPMWVTETAQAACGGSPWAATFTDTFRYVNQLGLLAQKGVKVVFHNTLAASDYSLIEQDTRAPRPNYWAAVLWRRIMGTTVLAPPPSPSQNVRVYAHCLRGRTGGVALAVINLGSATQPIPVPATAKAWLLEAPSLDSRTVTVNGRQPQLEDDGRLSGIEGMPVTGALGVAGKSIAFIAVSTAGNRACG